MNAIHLPVQATESVGNVDFYSTARTPATGYTALERQRFGLVTRGDPTWALSTHEAKAYSEPPPVLPPTFHQRQSIPLERRQRLCVSSCAQHCCSHLAARSLW